MELASLLQDMYSKGWKANLLYTSDFHIEFYKNDWHGALITVRFYETTSKNPDVEDILKSAKTAAERAQWAWNEFVYAIPKQESNGSITIIYMP
jgi:hypothetical protein